MSDLPTGWTEASLGDLGRYVNGRGFKKSEWAESGRPIIRIQNLTGTSDQFNYFDGEADERHIVRNGDLLVSWAATLGVFKWTGEEAVLNQHIFKVESHIHPGFHRYLIEHTLDDLLRQAHGSGMVHITKGKFDSTQVLMPPLSEQERIVTAIEDHFSHLEAAERSLRRATGELPKLLSDLTARIVHGQSLEDPGKGIDRATVDLPQGWKWLGLEDLGELGRGKSKHRPRNDPDLYGGDYPFIQTGDVAAASNGVVTTYSQTYSDVGLAQSRLWPARTVAITIAANIADSALLGFDACFPDSVVGFVADSERVLPEWVETFIRTAKSDLERYAPATAQKNINLEILRRVRIPTPPLDVQAELLAKLSTVESVVTRVREEVATASARGVSLRQSVLSTALSGQLVPQDPSDEPASAVLERLRREATKTPSPRRGSA